MTLQKNAGAVRRFAKLSRFGAWLQNLPNKLVPPPIRLIQIGSAFWQSRALYVAARLDIAGALADGEASAETLAERIGADADALYRLLRMLAAIGVFEEVADRRFKNNKLSSCLRQDHPNSVRAMVLMHNSPEMSRPWFEQLEQGVRGGGVPFESAHGQAFYSYMDGIPEFDALFAQAMDSVEALAGDSFATDFDWSRFERIIDVGGSKGAKSLAILKRHPHLKALVADREQVIRGAEQFWKGQGEGVALQRMSFEACDLLQSVPKAHSDKDIYLLSAVLHGFDDEACITALHHVAEAAAASDAAIAVMEMVMPDNRTDMGMAAFDMQMFVNTRGRERTLAEWGRLFADSGLVLQEVVGLQTFGNILVLRAAHCTDSLPCSRA
ncbi:MULTISPECIES: methyltransferase [Methylomonas]|uniref:Methyltransferase n=2 Tax=Methylomonas TaxID=416 RepID=A0A140E5X4_9GAMM|nr:MULTISPECIES: methyltransferase [Methylomonas]AMK78798.1 methyltransferase [Methylomonas denitrificans]OAI08381.1 methyltransferase [Methylomonas methanica]TCV83446.1 hydroxyneurosporene-O-methyltransferase [Methylomonas methanica]